MGDRHLRVRTWNAYGTCNVTSYSTGHPQSARLCDDLRPPEKSRGETGQSITTRPKSRNLCRWLHRSRASQRGLHRDPLRVVHHGSRAAHPSLERWRFDLPVHALRGPKGEEGRRGRGGARELDHSTGGRQGVRKDSSAGHICGDLVIMPPSR